MSHTYELPRGPRDSRRWYLDADPMEQVDYGLVDFVDRHAGTNVLDLGCGLGGYARALADRRREVRALDVVKEYVERARALGVRADLYDGERVPLADGEVETVILLEVVEHLDDPVPLLREARRVAARNVLLSTPNATQAFEAVPVEFSHMLDLDHKHHFTVDSLRELLEQVFARCEIEQSSPVDAMLAGLVLPRPLRPLYRLLDRAGLVHPRFYSRLLARMPAS